MKTLSVMMPWPWLIFRYGKDVENRSWFTEYRGRIFIRASKEPSDSLIHILSRYKATPTDEELEEILDWCGCIVGSVELVDCVQNYNSPWAESGAWHWVLRNPELLRKPMPAQSSLGLWGYGGKDIRDKL